MWCSYPRCFRERSARCVTCGQAYCDEHCSHWVYGSADRVHECDLCRQHLTPEQFRREHPPGLLASSSGISLLLLSIAVGIAFDIAAKGSGLIALWTFALAFVAFATCMQH
jgi:hypothetical protein